MSTANLNVWITDFGDPCHIQDTDTWFVHILDCAGNPLKWCKKEYIFLPAKCGHLEIDIPPGCYAIFAGHSPRGAGVRPFGNRLTHVQVVRLNCGDHACVTLFSPSMWFCGTWFSHAVRTQLEGFQAANVDQRLARTAIQAVDALLEKIGPDPFTANMRKAIGDREK